MLEKKIKLNEKKKSQNIRDEVIKALTSLINFLTSRRSSYHPKRW